MSRELLYLLMEGIHHTEVFKIVSLVKTKFFKEILSTDVNFVRSMIRQKATVIKQCLF